MRSFDEFMNAECIEKFSHNSDFCKAWECGAIQAIRYIREGLHQFHIDRLKNEPTFDYWARHQILAELDKALRAAIEDGRI